MKKKITAIVSAAALTAGMFTAYAAKPSEPLSPAEKLESMGILQGFEDGELHLERELTRAEFAKIFCDSFLSEAGFGDTDIEFKDVDNKYWGAQYIKTAALAGVISGFEDGSFRPEEKITYEQAVKIIVRYIENYDMAYPEGYVAFAVENGISDSVEALIGETLTRGETAYLIDNAMNYDKDRKAEYDAADGNMMKFSASGGSSMSMSSMVTSALNAAPEMPESVAAESFYDYDGFYGDNFNTEEYTANEENVFKNALTSPLSTFSIDTDTASYSNMRRFALNGQLPPNGSIRTEELINYFDYDNPLPEDGSPFAVSAEVGECPWNSANLLAKIDIQGAELAEKQPSNLVFLLDTSGSMYSGNKLPLVKKSLKLLLDELDGNDTISIVTYASGTGVKLESTPVSEKDKIIESLDSLSAYGGTNGEDGINLAYEQAQKNLIDGNNRIILCTDGDFNIGKSSTGDLEKLIEEKRDKGIFLTVLGFGMGNYKDSRMETLADKGNGNYAYIDSEREAKKVFADEMPKTLYTIAKDVKIQAEFNPAAVKEYRLIGYENRVLNNEDFENDKKDAGELGCGANVTALYEIVSADGSESSDLKYQTQELSGSDELMTVKVRYKEPDGEESKLIEKSVDSAPSDEMSENFKFVSAVAELGMILNDSEYKGTADLDSVIALAQEGLGEDKFGFRTEFLHLADLLRYAEENPGRAEDFEISY